MNISINGDALQLIENSKYYVIDALYLMDIKKYFDVVSPNANDFELKKHVFPYNDFPFAKFNTRGAIFNVKQLEKVNYDTIAKDDWLCFCTDTGIIVFISESIFAEFTKNFDYDALLDSENEFINNTYWISLAERYTFGKIGLIVAPGIGSETDFIGSGTYRIIL